MFIIEIAETFFLFAWNIFWIIIFAFIVSAWIRSFKRESEDSQIMSEKKSTIGIIVSSIFSPICGYIMTDRSRFFYDSGYSFRNIFTYLIATTSLSIAVLAGVYVLIGKDAVIFQLIMGILFIFFMSILLIVIKFNEKIVLSKKNTDTIQNFDRKERMYGYFHDAILFAKNDILLGIIIASILAVLIPKSFWASIFTVTTGWSIGGIFGNALVGVLLGMLALSCTLGSMVTASVLWWNGVPVEGVMGFLSASLITYPMYFLYKKHYGLKIARKISLLFFLGAIFSAFSLGLIVDFFSLEPVVSESLESFYASKNKILVTALNIVFGILAWIFYKKGSSNKNMNYIYVKRIK